MLSCAVFIEGAEQWLGMVTACRILAIIADRFAFYAVVGFAWKSWKCARVGFSRNEMRAVVSKRKAVRPCVLLPRQAL